MTRNPLTEWSEYDRMVRCLSSLGSRKLLEFIGSSAVPNRIIGLEFAAVSRARIRGELMYMWRAGWMERLTGAWRGRVETAQHVAELTQWLLGAPLGTAMEEDEQRLIYEVVALRRSSCRKVLRLVRDGVTNKGELQRETGLQLVQLTDALGRLEIAGLLEDMRPGRPAAPQLGGLLERAFGDQWMVA